MRRRVFAYYFNIDDRDPLVCESDIIGEDFTVEQAQELIISFLTADLEEAFVDEWGVVNFVHNACVNAFCYVFEVTDGDWRPVVKKIEKTLKRKDACRMDLDAKEGLEELLQLAKAFLK